MRPLSALIFALLSLSFTSAHELKVSSGDCDFCPQRSYCLVSNTTGPDFHPHETDENLYFKCLCREGYDGDGWRCTAIDECIHDWPCPATEDGGFCVDTDPENSNYPLYKCGCRAGFEASSFDRHGATECIELSSAPSTTPPPDVIAIKEVVELKTVDLYLDVKGSAFAAILEEKDSLKLSMEQAFQELDTNGYLNEVKFNGLLTEYGFFNATDYGSGRFLQISDSFNTTNSTSTGVFQFDLSLYFSFVFSCIFCPADFFSTNDAFRRLIRGRKLDDSKFSGVPLNKLVARFIKKMSDNDIESISFESIIARLEASGEYSFAESCQDKCDPINQVCMNGKCHCKPGYFSASGVGGVCENEKECSYSHLNNCDVNADCTEVEGGFRCSCKSGYEGDGTEGTCTDEDECEGSIEVCPSDEVCINTVGSFYCQPPTSAPTPVPTPAPVPPPVVDCDKFHPNFPDCIDENPKTVEHNDGLSGSRNDCGKECS